MSEAPLQAGRSEFMICTFKKTSTLSPNLYQGIFAGPYPTKEHVLVSMTKLESSLEPFIQLLKLIKKNLPCKLL